MNTYKFKNNKMLNADIISPELTVAEFSDQLVKGEAAKIVNNLNCGQEMLQLFGNMRDDMHILNVTQMLEKMEHVWAKWSEQDFQIRRNFK